MNRSRALFLAAPGLGRSPGAKFAARESESAAQLPGVGRHTAGGVLRLYRSDAPFAKVVPIRTPAMEEKALLQRLGACRSLPKPDGRPFVGGMAQLRPPLQSFIAIPALSPPEVQQPNLRGKFFLALVCRDACRWAGGL